MAEKVNADMVKELKDLVANRREILKLKEYKLFNRERFVYKKIKFVTGF